MNKIIKRVGVALFIGIVVLTPSYSFAMTDQEVIEQRDALISQLISLLQQQIAILIAQLDAQKSTGSQITGNINPPTVMPAPYTITVTPQFGSGSWTEYHAKCRATGDCADSFLDGVVRFDISGGYKSAMLTYKSADSSETMGLTSTREHGYFKPNTEYTWSIDATNDAGQVAHDEGSFVTGSY